MNIEKMMFSGDLLFKEEHMKKSSSIDCVTSHRYVWFAAIDKPNSSDPIADYKLDLVSRNHNSLAMKLRKTADYIERHKNHTIEINSSN